MIINIIVDIVAIYHSIVTTYLIHRTLKYTELSNSQFAVSPANEHLIPVHTNVLNMFKSGLIKQG